jgi:hypothetical protein
MSSKVPVGTAVTTAVPMILLIFFTQLSCGSRQHSTHSDPLSLLKQGRYPEARVAAVAAGLDDDTNRAIAALTYIADAPVKSSALLSVKTLSEDVGGVRSAAVATQMLSFIFELPSVSPELSILAAETALGAVSYGPFSPGTQPTLTVGAASRDLSAAVLERVAVVLSSPDITMDRQRLLKIWNVCYSLDGGAFEAMGEYQAWRLFTSISGIGLFLSRSDPTGDLTNALLSAAVTVIEANPTIVVAARCDLSSPIDDLRKALSYNLDMLKRLENAVSEATGCSRGTYAPVGPRM